MFVCAPKAILAFRSLLSCCYWFGEGVEETVLSLFLKSRGGEAVWIKDFLYICSVAEAGHIPALRTVRSQAHGEHTQKAAGLGLQKKPQNQTETPKPNQNPKPNNKSEQHPALTPPPRKESIQGLSLQLSQSPWEEI